jgi:hypothetical protein
VREIDKNDGKKILFNSFPPKWRTKFIPSGQICEAAEIVDIIEFMSNEKLLQIWRELVGALIGQEGVNLKEDAVMVGVTITTLHRAT